MVSQDAERHAIFRIRLPCVRRVVASGLCGVGADLFDNVILDLPLAPCPPAADAEIEFPFG